MTPVPSRFTCSISANSRSVSRSVSDAVGSSRTSSDRSERNALAISTICCSARERNATRWCGRSGKSSRARISSAARRSSRLLSRPPEVASAPRNRFSSTVSCGTSENSWNTALMPSERAWCTEGRSSGSPRKNMRPLLGRSAPATIEIRVDLPAPFSPNRTCTSPGRRSKSTRSSASTPGKCLVIVSRRSRGTTSWRGGPCPCGTMADMEPSRPQSTVKVGLKSSGASEDERSNVSMFDSSIT